VLDQFLVAATIIKEYDCSISAGQHPEYNEFIQPLLYYFFFWLF
jgi:hypothetical protein